MVFVAHALRNEEFTSKFSWLWLSDLLRRSFQSVRIFRFCFLNLNFTITVSFFLVGSMLKVIWNNFINCYRESFANIIFHILIGKNKRPLPLMIILNQKWNIKTLSKMLLSKPYGIQTVKCCFNKIFWNTCV